MDERYFKIPFEEIATKGIHTTNLPKGVLDLCEPLLRREIVKILKGIVFNHANLLMTKSFASKIYDTCLDSLTELVNFLEKPPMDNVSEWVFEETVHLSLDRLSCFISDFAPQKQYKTYTDSFFDESCLKHTPWQRNIQKHLNPVSMFVTLQ